MTGGAISQNDFDGVVTRILASVMNGAKVNDLPIRIIGILSLEFDGTLPHHDG